MIPNEVRYGYGTEGSGVPLGTTRTEVASATEWKGIPPGITWNEV